jgi:hypothetical protein
MPQFESVSMNEALSKTASPSKRTEIIQGYVGYINQLRPRKAGRLQAEDGETIGAIRRRLGEAAKLSGANLVIRRVGEEIYFWKRPRRPGRPRKVAM